MSNSNKVKADFLGMPYGTASNRLKKQLMFKYVKLAGDNICYACDKPIESVDELSVEHKEPWLNRDLDKFWDLDNIAFSHLKCNVPNQRSSGKTYVQGPPPSDDVAWCSGHQMYLDKSLFHKNKSKRNGLKSHCTECFNEARRASKVA